MDDLFGGMFDLNGDGVTTPDEEIMGLMIFNTLEEDESSADDDED